MAGLVSEDAFKELKKGVLIIARECSLNETDFIKFGTRVWQIEAELFEKNSTEAARMITEMLYNGLAFGNWPWISSNN